MPSSDTRRIGFGLFVLDLSLRTVTKNGARIKLDPKVFDTLHYFVVNRGRLLTKEEILDAVWPDTHVNEANVQRNIHEIREALGAEAKDYIETRWREGYIFWPEVIDLSSISDDLCPWVGLRELREEDARYFFGREAEVQELLAKIQQTNFIAVVGSSGTGKSSLVRAGLIPALKRKQSENDPQLECRVAVFSPADSPAHKLSEALITLQDADKSLAGLVVIDQFEELTLCEEQDEQQAFVDNLVSLISRDGRLSLVLTIRTDFYSKFEAFPKLWRQITENQYGVTPLSREALHRTIAGPAQSVDLEIEPGLVDEILDDLGDVRAALPLLSHTMQELFKRREVRRLTLKSYRDIGGVRGAIANHADSVYERFSASDKKYVKHIMISLTKVGDKPEYDVRQRRLLSELVEGKHRYEDIQRVVQTLSNEHLLSIITDQERLRPDGSAGDLSVEICHEALIRHWPLLRKWLNENRESLLKFEQLDSAAKEWEEANQNPELVYKRNRLQEVESTQQQYAAFLKESHLRFLAASRELVIKEDRAEANRRRLKQIGKFFAILILLLLVGLAGAMLKWQEAASQRDLAKSRGIAAQAAAQLLSDPQLSLLLAVEAGRLASSIESSATLRRALARANERRVFAGHRLQVVSVAISPNGKYLLTGGADKEARLWDVATGTTLKVFAGHRDWINWAAFRFDGKQIVTASRDGTARIWNVETGLTTVELVGHQDSVQNAVFSPDGTKILTAGEDGTARVWNAQTGTLLLTLLGHKRWVNTAVYSPDGRLIATASGDNTAMIWDAETGRHLQTLSQHRGTVLSVAFDSTGKKLITSSSDKTAILWNVDTWERGIDLIGHEGPVNGAEFSRDGRWILTGSKDGTARVWDAQRGVVVVELRGHRSGINAAVFSPDGEFAFTASGDATARMWSPWLYAKLTSFQAHTGDVKSIGFSAAGDLLLTASSDGKVRIWSARYWNQVAEFVHPDSVERAVFSPDGSIVATACNDGKARLWETRSGQLKTELIDRKKAINSIAFSNDGEKIVTASQDGTVKIWSVTSNQLFRTLEWAPQGTQATEPLSVVFSPDGKLVAAACSDFVIRAWSVETGEAIFSLNIGTGLIHDLSFSPNGESLVAACDDETVRVWSVADRQNVAVLRGHEQSVNSANFSMGGALILSTSKDRTVRLWDLRANEMLGVVTVSDYEMTQASFSPNGKLITMTGRNGVVSVYECNVCDATLEELMRLAEERKTRELTSSERDRFLQVSEP
jgi:WD40 repeat protein/DNA-binding winged helix-turn-helix (wHTH) protein